MAANLSLAGHELTVWNRTAKTADEFAGEHPGVSVAATPREAAADVDVVFTMVVDGPQVRELLLGDAGAAAGARARADAEPGTVFVDCSTIGPEQARAIAAELRSEHNFDFLDAPVTGSAPRAQSGELVFMVGGEPETLERVRPALEAMGSLIVHAGEVGQGQTVKLINNGVAAINTVVVAQALLAATSQGADLDVLLEVMRSGSGGSRMVELKGSPMVTHNYTPVLFKLDHLLKDVRLCIEAVDASGGHFALAELAQDVLIQASDMGLGDEDFAALAAPLERDYGVRIGERPAGSDR